MKTQTKVFIGIGAAAIVLFLLYRHKKKATWDALLKRQFDGLEGKSE